MTAFNCKGKLYEFQEPVVMGILNLTPDSFYKSYLHESFQQITDQVGVWIEEGMQLLDIGGQSSRPGSLRVDAAEEKMRILPVIEHLSTAFSELLMSVDTYHASVAEAAIHAGAHIINDISAGKMDERMIETVAAVKAPYIIMHMQGTPETMQQHPQYEDVTAEVISELAKVIERCTLAGIPDVWVDPGFGFGKNRTHNYTLLKNLRAFQILEKPLLVGVSRKRMIYEVLQTTADKAQNGTTVVHTIALMNGANILRAHDVKEAVEAVRIFTEMQQAGV